jgi:hypothetical protein
MTIKWADALRAADHPAACRRTYGPALLTSTHPRGFPPHGRYAGWTSRRLRLWAIVTGSKRSPAWLVAWVTPGGQLGADVVHEIGKLDRHGVPIRLTRDGWKITDDHGVDHP